MRGKHGRKGLWHGELQNCQGEYLMSIFFWSTKMFHTDGQHNHSHFSETLRHKKEPTCLKLLSVADGSGDQAPKPHHSNELCGKSLLIPPWHLSCLGRCLGLTWRFFSAGSGIVHPATIIPQPCCCGKWGLWGHPSCFTSGELWLGGGGGKGQEETGRLRGWLVTDTVLKGRLYELVW